MNSESHPTDQVQIRRARTGDAAQLQRLSELEGRPAGPGDTLVAIVDGRILAAMRVGDGEAIADPFEHTAGLVAALADARADMGGPNQRRSRGLLRRLRRADAERGFAAPVA
jgi:hypothetical protein